MFRFGILVLGRFDFVMLLLMRNCLCVAYWWMRTVMFDFCSWVLLFVSCEFLVTVAGIDFLATVIEFFL
jgi:uncharacterized membrane protein